MDDGASGTGPAGPCSDTPQAPGGSRLARGRGGAHTPARARDDTTAAGDAPSRRPPRRRRGAARRGAPARRGGVWGRRARPPDSPRARPPRPKADGRGPPGVFKPPRRDALGTWMGGSQSNGRGGAGSAARPPPRRRPRRPRPPGDGRRPRRCPPVTEPHTAGRRRPTSPPRPRPPRRRACPPRVRRTPPDPTRLSPGDPPRTRVPGPSPRRARGCGGEAGSERTGRGWWADVAGRTRAPGAPRAGGDAEAPSDGRRRRRPGNGPGRATGGGGRRAPRVSRGSEAPGGPDPGDSAGARAATPPFPRRAEGAAARESGGRTAPETEARRDNAGPPRGRPEGAGTDAPGAAARRTRRPRNAGRTEAGRGSWARRDRAHSLRTTADPGPRRARASRASGRAPAPPARPLLLPLSNLSRPAGRHRAGPPAPRGGEKARPPAASRSGNDPSAGSPTETLLRLLLPLDSQVRPSSQRSARAVGRPRRGRSEGLTKPSNR